MTMTDSENTRTSRRTLQKEETRRLILKSAYTLFQTQGYDRTTMRQLADHCGVALGTLFKHFPDKPSILAGAFHEDIGAVINGAFDTLPHENLHQRLQHVLLEIYGFYATNPAFSRVLVKESLFLTGQAGESIHSQTMAFLERIGALFAGAIERKEIAPVKDITEASICFFSFYLLGLTAGLRGEAFDVRAQVALVNTLLQAHYPLVNNDR